MFGCLYDAPEIVGGFRCDGDHPCPSPQSCREGVCMDDPGVACGDLTCPPGEKCCDDPIELLHCVGAGDACAGLSALCDGAEDCGAGERCCGGDPASCGMSCLPVVCRDVEDCPASQPACCFHAELPWGTCDIEC